MLPMPEDSFVRANMRATTSAGFPPPNLTIAITFSVKLRASIRSVGESCAYGFATFRFRFLPVEQKRQFLSEVTSAA